jgi:hypothetical protein
MSNDLVELVDDDWECEACGEMKPGAGGEDVVLGATRVDDMIVSWDMAWICADCKGWAESVEWDRGEAMRDDAMIEAYQYEELK